MSQLRLFDRQVVEHFKGVLGSFDIEDDEAEHFEADATVVLIVTATVDGAVMKRAKDGDWIRTNKLMTSSVRVAVGELREELVDLFGLAAGEQLTLPVTGPVPSPGAPAAAPTSTPVVGQNGSAPPAAAAVAPDDDDDDEDEDEDEDDDYGGSVALPSPIKLPSPADATLRRFLEGDA
jgi:hypothetical protein